MSRMQKKGRRNCGNGRHESRDSFGADAGAHNHLFEQCRVFLETGSNILQRAC